jgi:hypothetical protein
MWQRNLCTTTLMELISLKEDYDTQREELRIISMSNPMNGLSEQTNCPLRKCFVFCRSKEIVDFALSSI